MARIEDAAGRATGSGYERLVGDAELGHLLSRVQAAVISSGAQLESLIKSKTALVANVDAFLDLDLMPEGVFVVDKQVLKRSQKLNYAGAEPDFVVFKRRGGQQLCHVIELKDGDTFDTKKAAAEHRAMHTYISKNAQHLPFIVQAHICCFNQESREAIVAGFKRRIPYEEAMTGREFCALLELDYEAIRQERAADAQANLDYLIRAFLALPAVKPYLAS